MSDSIKDPEVALEMYNLLVKIRNTSEYIHRKNLAAMCDEIIKKVE